MNSHSHHTEFFTMGHLLLLLPLLFLLLPSSSSSSIALPISIISPPSNNDELAHLASLAAASLSRARHLKHPKPTSTPTLAPLSPHSYGGYSIPISLGTPPQPLPLLLDTGSSLTWTPCTPSYRCTRCASPSNPAARLTSFLPRASSSARIAGCRNPKCLFIHPDQSPDINCRPDCTATNCSQICPPYVVMYGSGSTAGLLMLETLTLGERSTSGFAIGCSVFSDRQPSGGIAGFGRGQASFPAQLGLSKFSYCLVSRRFDDDARVSGTLTLDPEPGGGKLASTPFGANTDNSSDYYYLTLKKITISGKKVRIPYSRLVASFAGEGGVIIDSGTTFTYMSPSVFEPVAKAFVDRVGVRYNRSMEAERVTGLRPCFTLPHSATEIELPEMILRFKGGAEMRLPVQNYFAFVGGSQRTACLTIVTDGSAGGGGPSVIIGSFQQQNYYMMYDLERGRLGFRQQSCVAP